MSSVPFAVVDVFSTTAFKGNPLAIVDNRSANLTTTQMQLLTRQFNLSETTFFSLPTSPQANYKLRSFLPDGKEVFGAGHNILGVWWYLAERGLLDLSKPRMIDRENHTEEFLFHQELGGEIMPVKILKRVPRDGEPAEISVAIRQAAPKSHGVHPSPAALAASFGLEATDIGFSLDKVAAGEATSVLDAQVMSTSTTHHLIVPLSSTEALNRVVVQRDKLLEQLRAVDARAYGLFLFTPVPEGAENGRPVFQARFFSPGMSTEDPATGSAAGPLSAYLYRHGALGLQGGRGQIVVRQGLRLGRECVINVALAARGDGEEEVLEVDVIGGGVQVASGEIVVPPETLSF